MNKTIALLLFLAAALLTPRAHATDFVFSSFQCDPVSCTERTPEPVLMGTVSVTFSGVCTGGAVGAIESFATAIPC